MSLIKENIYFERIEDLKNQMNRLEMLSEIDKTDLKESAKSLLTECFQNVIQNATNDFLDQFIEPAFKATANSLLVELGLEELPEEVSARNDVLEYFLRAFQKQ